MTEEKKPNQPDNSRDDLRSAEEQRRPMAGDMTACSRMLYYRPRPKSEYFPGPYDTPDDLLRAVNISHCEWNDLLPRNPGPEFLAQLNRAMADVYARHPKLSQPPELDVAVRDPAAFSIQVDRARAWLILCLESRGHCDHSMDFSSVHWFGQTYAFAPAQAEAIKLLWAEWEKHPEEPLGLREKTIGQQIGSNSDRYRLCITFRGHPAWGAMIHAGRRGSFFLGKPSAPRLAEEPATKAAETRGLTKRPRKK
jgi:hypothetical protein